MVRVKNIYVTYLEPYTRTLLRKKKVEIALLPDRFGTNDLETRPVNRSCCYPTPVRRRRRASLTMAKLTFEKPAHGRPLWGAG